MKDNLSIVITMLVFVVLIVIFPLYNYFERQDDMSYNLALKETTAFVDEVLNSGYVDQQMYDDFVDKLGSTGNIYDIQLEGHEKIKVAENDTGDQGKTVLTGYNEQYLISYNNDIFNNIEAPNTSNVQKKSIINGAYFLNEGDQFYVKLKNTNTTMAGAIFNTIVPTSKKERIVVNYGGIVKNTGWNQVRQEYNSYKYSYTINFKFMCNGNVVTRCSVTDTSNNANGTTFENILRGSNKEYEIKISNNDYSVGGINSDKDNAAEVTLNTEKTKININNVKDDLTVTVNLNQNEYEIKLFTNIDGDVFQFQTNDQWIDNGDKSYYYKKLPKLQASTIRVMANLQVNNCDFEGWYECDENGKITSVNPYNEGNNVLFQSVSGTKCFFAKYKKPIVLYLKKMLFNEHSGNRGYFNPRFVSEKTKKGDEIVNTGGVTTHQANVGFSIIYLLYENKDENEYEYMIAKKKINENYALYKISFNEEGKYVAHKINDIGSDIYNLSEDIVVMDNANNKYIVNNGQIKTEVSIDLCISFKSNNVYWKEKNSGGLIYNKTSKKIYFFGGGNNVDFSSSDSVELDFGEKITICRGECNVTEYSLNSEELLDMFTNSLSLSLKVDVSEINRLKMDLKTSSYNGNEDYLDVSNVRMKVEGVK